MKPVHLARPAVTALLMTSYYLANVNTVNAAEQPFECDERLSSVHIATFDDLDFNVFTGQKWDELNRSHAVDIIVHWPDGHVTEGIEIHIQDLANMFVYAPDTRIEVQGGDRPSD